MLKMRPTPYSSISLPLDLRDELNIEKEKLSAELDRPASVHDLLRQMLALWRKQRNDPRPLPSRRPATEKLSPEEIQRLKELIAQNE